MGVQRRAFSIGFRLPAQSRAAAPGKLIVKRSQQILEIAGRLLHTVIDGAREVCISVVRFS